MKLTGNHPAKFDETSSDSDAVGPAVVHRRLGEYEIRGVQVGRVEVLQPDRTFAVRGEVDHGGGPVGGDRHVRESGDVRDRLEIDDVFPVGEILDGVGSVTGDEYEGVVALTAGERVVARAAVDIIVARAA